MFVFCDGFIMILPVQFYVKYLIETLDYIAFLCMHFGGDAIGSDGASL